MSAKRHLLTPEQEQLVVAAANEAPCLVGDRVWRVIARPERFDIRTVGSARIRKVDPHRRSTVISCGAAVFNAGAALRALGWSAAVRILPLRADSPLVASVRFGGRRTPTAYEQRLCDAMMGGEGYETCVGDLAHYWSGTMTDLEHAAREEGAQLTFLSEPEARKADSVLAEADSGYEGLVQDRYAKLAVLSTAADTHAAWVWAGIAWQRVLLAARLSGLSTSCVSTSLDIGDTRWRVQDVIAEPTWPQVVVLFLDTALRR